MFGRVFGRKSGQFSDSDEYDEAYEAWNERRLQREFQDSDDSERSTSDEEPQRPETPHSKPKLKFNVDDNENSDSDCNEDEDEIKMNSNFVDNGSFLKIRGIEWDVAVMAYSDEPQHNMFFRSPLYVSGYHNQFQVFFIMERFHHGNKNQFGVYACEVKKNGKASYESSVRHYKGMNLRLSKKDSICPKKTGFLFLGYLNLLERDNDWDGYLVNEESEVPLRFKINVSSTTLDSLTHLEKLLTKQEKDVILVLPGKNKFPANRKILSERSPTFAKILSKNSENDQIKIANVTPEVMKQLLQFIYTGTVSQLFSLTKELHTAAKTYKLKDLESMCQKLKSVNLPDPANLEQPDSDESD